MGPERSERDNRRVGTCRDSYARGWHFSAGIHGTEEGDQRHSPRRRVGGEPPPLTQNNYIGASQNIKKLFTKCHSKRICNTNIIITNIKFNKEMDFKYLIIF